MCFDNCILKYLILSGVIVNGNVFNFGFSMFIVSIKKCGWFLCVDFISSDFIVITSRSYFFFFWDCLGFSLQTIMPFANRDGFLSIFFSFKLYTFTSLSCLLQCLELPILCWVRVVRTGILALFPTLGKAFSISLLSVMLAVGFMEMLFIKL